MEQSINLADGPTPVDLAGPCCAVCGTDQTRWDGISADYNGDWWECVDDHRFILDHDGHTYAPDLEVSDWKHTYTCNGIGVWELGEDGGTFVTFGHVDKTRFAEAIDAYHKDVCGQDRPRIDLAETAADARHQHARLANLAEFPHGDFEVHLGEGGVHVTVWTTY